MFVPNTWSIAPSRLLTPNCPRIPPAIPPAIPAIGLANGPTTGRTGGVTAIAALAPARATGVAATDSRAEAPKAPRLLVSPSLIGCIPGLGYIPKAAPPRLSIGAEADVAGAEGVTTSSSPPQEDLGAATDLDTTSSFCPKSAMISPSYALAHHLACSNYLEVVCRTLLY